MQGFEIWLITSLWWLNYLLLFTLQDYAKTDGLEYVCPHCSITTYKKKPHRVANGSPQGITNPRIPWFSFGLPISRFRLRCFYLSFCLFLFYTRNYLFNRLVDEFWLRWCAAKPISWRFMRLRMKTRKWRKEVKSRAHKEDFIIGSFLTSSLFR